MKRALREGGHRELLLPEEGQGGSVGTPTFVQRRRTPEEKPLYYPHNSG